MTESEKKLLAANGFLDKAYGQKVNRLIRERYTQSDVEAILNNYLSDPENEQYKREFVAFQEFRAECKRQAKEAVYG